MLGSQERDEQLARQCCTSDGFGGCDDRSQPRLVWGIANMNLMEGGEFVAEKTVALDARDSGGDDRTTYEAPDKDNDSKKATTPASEQHFTVKGQPMPVGRITFKRR